MDTVVTSSAERIHIILVHGTWGRGILLRRRRSFLLHRKRWFEDGSTFRRSLDDELKDHSLDGTVRAFLWSGANSVTARASAAKTLAEDLEIVLRTPNTRPVMIAHSQGGNVVLCALKHLKFKKDRMRFIALSVPFIRVYLNKSPLHYSAYLTYSAIPAFILMVLSIYSFIRFFHLDPTISLILTAVIVVMYTLSIIMFVKPYLRVINWTKLRRLQEEASYQPKDLQDLRMIVIRGIDDEASLALAVGSIGARIGRLFLSYAIRIMYFLMMFVAIFAAMFSTSMRVAGSKIPNWLDISLSMTIYILLIVVLISPISVNFISGCCKMFFGREFFRNWQHFEIAVGTAPDAHKGVPTTTLPPNSGSTGLRHAIYDHPDCAKKIINWLIERS